MKQGKIVRLDTSLTGTFGVMTIDGRAFCVTLERFQYGNTQFKSCIPEGQYLCKKVISPKYGETFAVMHVSGRGDILFHWGNWAHNSKGCILVGRSYATLSGKRGITSSKATWKELMKVMPNEFKLTITNAY